MATRRERATYAPGAQAPESGPRSVPHELRGRRVLTRLHALIAERREGGLEATVVHLAADDEQKLREGAAFAFGTLGEQAAERGTEAFREFLRGWLRASELEARFDADETRVG